MKLVNVKEHVRYDTLHRGYNHVFNRVRYGTLNRVRNYVRYDILNNIPDYIWRYVKQRLQDKK